MNENRATSHLSSLTDLERGNITPRRPLEHTEDFARFGAVVLLNVRKARLVNETLLH